MLPFRIQDVPLFKALRYHIRVADWVDAARPPLDSHLGALVRTARGLGADPAAAPATPSAGP